MIIIIVSLSIGQCPCALNHAKPWFCCKKTNKKEIRLEKIEKKKKKEVKAIEIGKRYKAGTLAN